MWYGQDDLSSARRELGLVQRKGSQPTLDWGSGEERTPDETEVKLRQYWTHSARLNVASVKIM